MPNLSSLITKFLTEVVMTAGEKLTLRGLIDAASKTVTETISGNKTFDGQMELTGQSAAGGNSAMNLTLCDARYAGPQVSVSAVKSADQTGTTASAYTKVTYESEEWDTGSNFASSRFTSPVARKIRVTASVYVTAGTTSESYLGVYKNGVLFKRIGGGPSIVNNQQINGSIRIDCAINDYLEIFFYSNSSRTIALSSATWAQFEVCN